MTTIIQATNISKQFRIGTVRTTTLRDTITNTFTGPIKRLRNVLRGQQVQGAEETFWALKDVSFEIEQGETIGLIGQNGSGKSTLLKLISRISEPTQGRITLQGKVGSLLEVGTGFHPELTGRENIFFNGVILGMTIEQVRQRLDAIIAFSEIEKFIDTPVKHYSSGMYMRLAFAVATHLDAPILLLDEVLAVGDAAFQKKCLSKIADLTREGRTVIIVTHNLRSIQYLCDRALWLNKGQLVGNGPSARVIEQYLQSFPTSAEVSMDMLLGTIAKDPTVNVTDIRLTQNGSPAQLHGILNDSPLEITIEYHVDQAVDGLRIILDLCDENGEALTRSFHDEFAPHIPHHVVGRYQVTATLAANLLMPQSYELRVHTGIHNVRYCTPAMGIRIPIQVQNVTNRNLAYHFNYTYGKLMLEFDWQHKHLAPVAEQPE
jgi:lipopolysaccharide transport system ATP-binding protein